MDDTFAVTPSSFGVDEEPAHEGASVEDIALKREAYLAKVSETEGWQEVEKLFEERIEGFRTGAWIQGKETMPDNQLGQAYRVELLVASELSSILAQVNNAGKAVREQRERAGKSR